MEASAGLHVLHPPARGVGGGDNANSLVLLVQHQRRRILLPGDLEGEGLHRLLAGPPLRCDVAMAPHHGSAASRPADFVAWCRPRWLVASCGFGRDLSTAHRASRDVQGRFLHTAECGAVRVVIEAGEVRVRCWRREPW